MRAGADTDTYLVVGSGRGVEEADTYTLASQYLELWCGSPGYVPKRGPKSADPQSRQRYCEARGYVYYIVAALRCGIRKIYVRSV